MKLINYKVSTTGIELPVNELNIFSKIYGIIENKLGYRIVILFRFYILEIAIKLLKPIPTYI